jgi:DNA transformation protein and related proteins
MVSRKSKAALHAKIANVEATLTSADLPNLGPKSLAFLRKAGITSTSELASLGSVAAYAMEKRVEPNASLNLLWALEGALTGLHWREVARLHRTSLLLVLETHEHQDRG